MHGTAWQAQQAQPIHVVVPLVDNDLNLQRQLAPFMDWFAAAALKPAGSQPCTLIVVLFSHAGDDL